MSLACNTFNHSDPFGAANRTSADGVLSWATLSSHWLQTCLGSIFSLFAHSPQSTHWPCPSCGSKEKGAAGLLPPFSLHLSARGRIYQPQHHLLICLTDLMAAAPYKKKQRFKREFGNHLQKPSQPNKTRENLAHYSLSFSELWSLILAFSLHSASSCLNI